MQPRPGLIIVVVVFALLVLVFFAALEKAPRATGGGAAPEGEPKKEGLLGKIAKTGLMVAPLALLAL